MQTLNFFTAFLIRSAIAVIETKLIGVIKNVELRKAMLLTLQPLKRTIEVLSDNIEMNEAQVKEVWDGFVSKDLPDFAEGEIAVLIEKIKDENIKAVVGTLSDPVIDIFRLLVDSDKDNEAQIKARIQELTKDPKSLEVLIRNVAIPIAEKIKDEKVREFLVAYLQSILEGGILIG